MLDLVWATRSHPGKKRTVNQDAVLAASNLFAVADGMGGHSSGEVASGVTIETLAAVADGGRVTRPAVLDAIREADERIRALVRESGKPMGTTVCGISVTKSGDGEALLGVFNVGDSRVYRLCDGHLILLTHDHSVVQELIDSGELSSHEAVSHPDRNVITRSLGSSDHLDIDWLSIKPTSRDRYLVTSDGLTKELDDAAIRDILVAADGVDDAVNQLLERALDAGGRDNVSVILVDVSTVGLSDGPEWTEFDPLDVDTAPSRVDNARLRDSPPMTTRALTDRSNQPAPVGLQ